MLQSVDRAMYSENMIIHIKKLELGIPIWHLGVQLMVHLPGQLRHVIWVWNLGTSSFKLLLTYKHWLHPFWDLVLKDQALTKISLWQCNRGTNANNKPLAFWLPWLKFLFKLKSHNCICNFLSQFSVTYERKIPVGSRSLDCSWMELLK